MSDPPLPAGIPPRVLHVLPTLSLGGAELFVLRLARAAARTPGAPAMAVCAMHRGGPVAARLEAAGVPHRILGVQRASVRRPWAALRDARRLVAGAARQAREFGAACIQTHLDDADWLGAAVARRLGLPLVLTFHSTLFLPEGRQETSLRARLRRRVQRRTWARADALVAVGREVRDRLLATPGVDPGRVHLVPSAIEEPCAEPREVLARRHAHLLGPGPHLVTVGRLVPNKGHDLVLRAAARLRTRWPELRLWVAGEGPERAALEALAAELSLDGGAVRFLGARDDVPELLALADVFLSGSRWEGLGLAAAEAQAAGLPVVAFAVGGLRDVVADGSSGILVPDGDWQALAAAAAELLADPVRRAAMAAAGRERARPYRIGQVLTATCRVYAGLPRGGESPRIRPRARASPGPGR